MKNASLLTLGMILITLTGCTSSGEIKGQRTSATVDLSRANYRVLKAGAVGKSSGFKLLGFLNFSSPTYAKAKNNLYKDVDVPLEGKSIAIINQTEDSSTLNLLLFQITKLTLSADVIEYTDQ
ncbi:MAG: DUF6567 family protein [Candidatus Hermodarchaeota archaeon]